MLSITCRQFDKISLLLVVTWTWTLKNLRVLLSLFFWKLNGVTVPLPQSWTRVFRGELSSKTIMCLQAESRRRWKHEEEVGNFVPNKFQVITMKFWTFCSLFSTTAQWCNAHFSLVLNKVVEVEIQFQDDVHTKRVKYVTKTCRKKLQISSKANYNVTSPPVAPLRTDSARDYTAIEKGATWIPQTRTTIIH